MTGQSHKHSIFETITNIIIGYIVAICTQMLVFPLFGIHIQMQSQLGIGVFFVVVSFCRSYLLRRFWNWVMIRDRANLSPEQMDPSELHLRKESYRGFMLTIQYNGKLFSVKAEGEGTEPSFSCIHESKSRAISSVKDEIDARKRAIHSNKEKGKAEDKDPR